MALERRQPLPAGRYWIDTGGQRTIVLAGWLQTYQTIGLAKVERSEGYGIEAKPQLWTLFRTSQPLVWPGAFLGYPTIATDDVHSKADTVKRPPKPPGPFEPGGVFDPAQLEGLGSVAILAGLAYLAFGGNKR